MERIGNWMQTYTGRQYWPLSPRPEDVHIEDIAHALSLMCRYSGHCINFYSVAEHSCHMFDHAKYQFKAWALLHDASEAYLTDIIRPLKPYLKNYLEIEDLNMTAIVNRFSLLPFHMPPEVKFLDDSILHDEMSQNMTSPPQPWSLKGAPLNVSLQYWTPAEAEKEFLTRFGELFEYDGTEYNTRHQYA